MIGYPAFLLVCLGLLWVVSIRMPGKSFDGSLPALSGDQAQLESRLLAHVEMLATRIGERNSLKMHALDSAAAYVDSTLTALGYTTRSEPYLIRGRTFRNIEVTIPGRTKPDEIIVVGGHYDSVDGTPGADDNASGTAAILELARLFHGARPARTIKLVAFTNEEPPFFWTEDMGSLRYARAARARGDNIVAMLSLENDRLLLGQHRQSALPASARMVLSKARQLSWPRGERGLTLPGPDRPLGFSGGCKLSFRRLRRAKADSWNRVVGSVVVLAGRLSGSDDH